MQATSQIFSISRDAGMLTRHATLQAADNPEPFGHANTTAVKYPAAFTKGSKQPDVALAFLDADLDTYLRPGFDTALEGPQTIYTAGTHHLLWTHHTQCPACPVTDSVLAGCGWCLSLLLAVCTPLPAADSASVIIKMAEPWTAPSLATPSCHSMSWPGVCRWKPPAIQHAPSLVAGTESSSQQPC